MPNFHLCCYRQKMQFQSHTRSSPLSLFSLLSRTAIMLRDAATIKATFQHRGSHRGFIRTRAKTQHFSSELRPPSAKGEGVLWSKAAVEREGKKYLLGQGSLSISLPSSVKFGQLDVQLYSLGCVTVHHFRIVFGILINEFLENSKVKN